MNADCVARQHIYEVPGCVLVIGRSSRRAGVHTIPVAQLIFTGTADSLMDCYCTVHHSLGLSRLLYSEKDCDLPLTPPAPCINAPAFAWTLPVRTGSSAMVALSASTTPRLRCSGQYWTKTCCRSSGIRINPMLFISSLRRKCTDAARELNQHDVTAELSTVTGSCLSDENDNRNMGGCFTRGAFPSQ